MSVFNPGVVGKMLGKKDRPEGWKVCPNEAMKECDLFEVAIQYGINRFQLISLMDENWNADVAAGRVAFDENDGQELFGYYRNWLSEAERFAVELDAYRRQGFVVKQEDEFRRHLEEARGVCAEDAEFFSGDALARLCDQAIDENRLGRTLPLGDDD